MRLARLAAYAALGGPACVLVGLCLPSEVGVFLFFPASLCESVLGMALAHLTPGVFPALVPGRRRP